MSDEYDAFSRRMKCVCLVFVQRSYGGVQNHRPATVTATFLAIFYASCTFQENDNAYAIDVVGDPLMQKQVEELQIEQLYYTTEGILYLS